MGVYTTVIPVFLIKEAQQNPLRWCLGEDLTTDVYVIYPAALVPVTVETSCEPYLGEFDMWNIAQMWRDFYQHMQWPEVFPKMPKNGKTLGKDMNDWRRRYTSETNLLSALTYAQMAPMKVVASPCSVCAPIGQYVLGSGYLLHTPVPEQKTDDIPYWKEAELSYQIQQIMAESHLYSDSYYQIHDEAMDDKAKEMAEKYSIDVAFAKERLGSSAEGDKVTDTLTDELLSELGYAHGQGWRLPTISTYRVMNAIDRIAYAESGRGTGWSDWLYEAHQGYTNGIGMRRSEADVA